MFDFIWQNKKWSIDATHEDGSLGRLIYDDHINPNCTMKRIIVEGKPCLCLFAARDIIPGEELAYDYGGSHWPWRKPPCKDDDNMTAIENCSEDSVTTASTSRFTAEPPCKDDDNMTAIENCSEDSVTTAGTSRFTAEPPCKDDDNMTAIENCSEDSVTTAGTSRFTAEPPCKDDDNMTAIENCSEDSVTTASTSRFTAEPLVDYSDSDDGVVCSKNMTSYKKRSVIRDDSDDLFENSSVNSDDDHTDIQNDIRRNRAPFAISEQHYACTTTSKRAKNTRVTLRRRPGTNMRYRLWRRI
ncbi:uncharacterized protein [Pseudorasbora parva]|uniref:uncharacterized protein isoform X2 n=1 Tax=Pseudorasbora parva TaxID=51549 RepID=UPI00351DA976